MSERTEKRTSGRPHDPEAAGAVKAAAVQLVRERGYAKVSIAAIAAQAGVARQTVYNRWPSKADLMLEAVFEEAWTLTAEPKPEDGSGAAAQLEAFLVQVFAHLTRNMDPVRALIAAAQEDAAFGAVFRDKFVAPRERVVTALLERAQARGELGAERDAAMLSAFVHGAFWYRMLNGRRLDAALARAIVAEVFAAG
ncbi:TetR/AcrR family transcriptional regulator C-terminal ligand-binding domain-containing protein [Alphaproteobacteria bacterium KMM 3653]|uniref:TetR/AcrR family transcriptional regulator C-terminal ligand-binding domain-containing protein n=1 Tax=Harenicola maris TaxID=2841044 RepID=A0AAP2CM93_9RHOB|nr:TetR/AcrR family transcriptional regulator C-terminal ligand-binding domain-containing protein [Harenicola maris]